MARRDEQVPTNWLSPVDALRRMQELSAQFVDGTRAFSERDDGDDDEAPSSGPSPVTAWAERAAEMSTMWVSPMRAMLEEQQELIDAISSWADSQRELADRFSALADRHREVTDGVLAALTPTLDNLDRLAGRTPPAKRASRGRSSSASKGSARKSTSSEEKRP